MLPKLAWAAAVALALCACTGNDATKEPVDEKPIIPDAPGDAGETKEKPAGAGQAGGTPTASATPSAKPATDATTEKPTPSHGAPIAVAPGEHTVVPGALNVRKEPSMTGEVARKALKGEKVQVQSCAKGWCKIGEGEYVGAKHLQ